MGEPRRKPKHFEVLGRRDKELTELHIELDGHIRKMKPVGSDDPKWSEALRAASQTSYPTTKGRPVGRPFC